MSKVKTSNIPNPHNGQQELVALRLEVIRLRSQVDNLAGAHVALLDHINRMRKVLQRFLPLLGYSTQQMTDLFGAF